MEQFKRHETAAREYLNGSSSGNTTRFDASFYRTHDALGYIPSDMQSVRSQATYSSGLPTFTSSGPFGAQRGPGGAKRSTYSSYASSVVSQDVGNSGSIADTGSVIDGGSSIAYNQSDRLRRRGSFGSSSVAGASDLGSISQYDYKSQDDSTDLDDLKSQYAGTQSGVTVF
jgi:regulator of nonsense transcripts 1